MRCLFLSFIQLIQSGRFIKEHQAGGGTGRMKLGMQRAVPIATERFQDALDELENEVLLAQTVMRRDLVLLKENRKKREAAAKQHEAERARQAAEAKKAPSQAPPSPPLPVAKEEETHVKIEKDTTPKSVEPTSSHESKPPARQEQADLKREEDHIPPPIKTDNMEPPRDPLFDGTPTTANPQESEFDFEAMFGDSAMDTGGDENNQDMMMDMSGDMGFNLDDGNDGSSLLRGLEDFAKSGDNSNNSGQNSNLDLDMPMPDLPDLNTASSGQPAPAPEAETKKEPTPKTDAPKPVTAPPAGASTAAAVPEPVADTKTKENADNGSDVMTMAVNDLEDLFNMDEYENPENSSFADAFFNFE